MIWASLIPVKLTYDVKLCNRVGHIVCLLDGEIVSSPPSVLSLLLPICSSHFSFTKLTFIFMTSFHAPKESRNSRRPSASRCRPAFLSLPIPTSCFLELTTLQGMHGRSALEECIFFVQALWLGSVDFRICTVSSWAGRSPASGWLFQGLGWSWEPGAMVERRLRKDCRGDVYALNLQPRFDPTVRVVPLRCLVSWFRDSIPPLPDSVLSL